MSYSDYLQGEHWQQTREQKLTESPACQQCGKGRGLEVHHLTYDRIGHEEMGDLQVLCATCHRRTHDRVPDAKDFKRTGGGTLYGWETQRFNEQGEKR